MRVQVQVAGAHTVCYRRGRRAHYPGRLIIGHRRRDWKSSGIPRSGLQAVRITARVAHHPGRLAVAEYDLVRGIARQTLQFEVST